MRASIQIYSKVPLSKDFYNVIAFNQEVDLITWLDTYSVAGCDTNSFNVLGYGDENGNGNHYVDIKLNSEDMINVDPMLIRNANYLRCSIRYEGDTYSYKNMYYFVDSFEMRSPTVIRLILTLDIWNTNMNVGYWTYVDGKETQYGKPEIKFAHAVQGHFLASEDTPKYNYLQNGTNSKIPSIYVLGETRNQTDSDAEMNTLRTVDITTKTKTESVPTNFIYNTDANNETVENLFENNLPVSVDSGKNCAYTLFYHVNLADYGEVVFAFKDWEYLYNNIENINLTLPLLSNEIISFITDNSILTKLVSDINISKNFDLLDIYAIPSCLISSNFFDNWDNTSWALGNSYDAGLKLYTNFRYRTVENTISFTPIQVKADNYGQTFIGTKVNQIEVVNDKKYHYFNLLLKVDTDVHLTLCGDNTTIELADNFKVSGSLNEYSYWVNNNKYTKMFNEGRIFTDTLLNLTKDTISQNPQKFVKDVIESGEDYLQLEATYADIKSHPNMIRTTGSGLTEHIFMFVYNSSNEKQIKDANKMFGMTFDELINNVQWWYNDGDFAYMKFNSLNLIGEMNNEVRRRIEQLFKRGIRIWYNTTHFLEF